MIESDVVDCVIALGKNLFYNSTMESCLLVCSNRKEKIRKGNVLFIDARKELKQEKTVSFLEEQHISKILNIYKKFTVQEGLSYIAPIKEILEKDSNLNIPLYVKPLKDENEIGLNHVYKQWEESSAILNDSMKDTFKIL